MPGKKKQTQKPKRKAVLFKPAVTAPYSCSIAAMNPKTVAAPMEEREREDAAPSNTLGVALVAAAVPELEPPPVAEPPAPPAPPVAALEPPPVAEPAPVPEVEGAVVRPEAVVEPAVVVVGAEVVASVEDSVEEELELELELEELEEVLLSEVEDDDEEDEEVPPVPPEVLMLCQEPLLSE
jgi:hypothetical protein